MHVIWGFMEDQRSGTRRGDNGEYQGHAGPDAPLDGLVHVGG